jgi:hypothetical protein
MSDQDGFDERLAARFEREHRHVADDAFVASTMRNIRAGRRQQRVLRIGARVAVLAVIVAASPWLIASVDRLNAAVGSSLSWAEGLPGAFVIAALAAGVWVARRVRGR